MSEETKKYKLLFNVLGYDNAGHYIEVCLHSMSYPGFGSIEMAMKALASLQEADRALMRTRAYEIQPILSAEDYGSVPLEFSMGEDEDVAPDFIGETEPDPKPGVAN